MKKSILLIFILSVLCLNIKGQTTGNDSIPNNAIFKLFPTQNMWNFIKLDTRNGRMWQVQFSVESNKRFESKLSGYCLAPDEEEFANRFTLAPTKNINTFLLLDQIDGRVWQVQWSFKSEERGIWRIE